MIDASKLREAAAAVLDRAQQRIARELHPRVCAEVRRRADADDQRRAYVAAREHGEQDERARQAARVAGELLEVALDRVAETQSHPLQLRRDLAVARSEPVARRVRDLRDAAAAQQPAHAR